MMFGLPVLHAGPTWQNGSSPPFLASGYRTVKSMNLLASTTPDEIIGLKPTQLLFLEIRTSYLRYIISLIDLKINSAIFSHPHPNIIFAENEPNNHSKTPAEVSVASPSAGSQRGIGQGSGDHPGRRSSEINALEIHLSINCGRCAAGCGYRSASV